MILPMRHSTPTFPTVWMCTDLGAAHGPDAAALGLPEVLQLLAGEAKTAPGRRLCLQPELAESAARCRESYAVVAEALEAARLAAPPPFGHPLTSILDGVDEASGGAVLGVPALSEISAALVALEATAAWGAEPQRALASPRLASMAAEATPPARLLEVFAGAFEGDGSGGVRLSSKHFARLGQRRVRAEKTSRSTADAMRALLRCAPPFALRGRSTPPFARWVLLPPAPLAAALLLRRRKPEFVAQLSEESPQPRQREGRWVVPAGVLPATGRLRTMAA